MGDHVGILSVVLLPFGQEKVGTIVFFAFLVGCDSWAAHNIYIYIYICTDSTPIHVEKDTFDSSG